MTPSPYYCAWLFDATRNGGPKCIFTGVRAPLMIDQVGTLMPLTDSEMHRLIAAGVPVDPPDTP